MVESGLLETIFQTFLCLFVIGKIDQWKHFPVKEKFSLVFRKVFFFYFGHKTLSRSCEKFRNIILFVDYNKFDHQTFDCYIFCFEFFFFNFTPYNLIFILTLVLIFYDCYLLFSYYFFNWNFLSFKFDPHSFDCYLFYLK